MKLSLCLIEQNSKNTYCGGELAFQEFFNSDTRWMFRMFYLRQNRQGASEQTETSAKDGFISEDVMLLIPATANSYDIRGTETRSTGCILAWHKL